MDFGFPLKGWTLTAPGVASAKVQSNWSLSESLVYAETRKRRFILELAGGVVNTPVRHDTTTGCCF
ncbi:MAG: hypothetical protein GX456_07665 [Verrucomicrobia bacterium]|nr:hypothetical protein [Verrucomicrobiota bacterium]